MGEFVTSVEANAFEYVNLGQITFGNSIEKIASDAFKWCDIENVIYNGYIEDWCSIDFGNQLSNPLYCASTFYVLDDEGTIDIEGRLYSEVIDIYLSENVIEISDYAFYNYQNLRNVVMADSITNVGKYAFANCGNLESVIISNNVEKIDSYSGCACFG